MVQVRLQTVKEEVVASGQGVVVGEVVLAQSLEKGAEADLIDIRTKTTTQVANRPLEFHSGLAHPRWVWYDRGEIQVLLNCGDQAWPLAGEGEVLFAPSSIKTVLLPGGICIRRIKHG